MAPVVGPLTRLYQTTHPAKFAGEVEQWQGDITATVNELANAKGGQLQEPAAQTSGLHPA